MASKIKAAIREVEKINAAVGGRDTTPAKWMGKWEAEKSYGTLQKVEHLGNSYVCIKNCAGMDPEADVALGDGVQGVCWMLIAKKGDDGEGIESIDEVGGGEEIDGDRVVGRWKDYRITYASGKTFDYRVFGGADGKQGLAGAGITNIFFKEATKEGNVYYIQVGQNIYPFTAPKGDDGVSPTVTVTPIANGHRITITDAAGQKSFDVMDGEDGEGGGGGGGKNGATFYPYVDTNGNLSWTNNGGLENPETVNIKGKDGDDGENGATFYPSVNTDGNLSWTNDGGLPNPNAVNIKGKDGDDGKNATINGVNALNVQGGDGIEAAMNGSTLTIKAKTVEEWTFTVEGEDGVDTTVTKKVVLV